MNTIQQIRFVWKPIVFLLCLLPAILLTTALFGITGDLGANPVETMLDHFGNWGLRFVMIALAVTPLRRVTGFNWLQRFRRMLGLFAFFYVLLHFLTYFILDQGMLMSAIFEDIVERPYITVGFTALLLLTAMAVTSFTVVRRRMGRVWDRLHMSVYAVGILGVWHFWWQVKADVREPLIYALILSALLGYRLFDHRRKRSALRRRQVAAGVS